MDISRLTNEDLRVLWAAMQAMVNDIHAPQDTMSEAEWDRAEFLTKALDREINKRGKST